jgi:spore germination protein GerM
MQEHEQRVRRIPLGIVAALSAVVLAAGGGAALWAWKSAQSPTTTGQSPPTVQSPTTLQSPTTSTSPHSSPRVQTPNEKAVKVYWLKDTGSHFEVVPSSIALQNADKPSTVLDDAFKSLLAGSSDPKLTTTIPQGTKLRSLEVRDDGVHVDLSQEFTSGGGSASMTGRLAQVIYTATSLNPNAKVWINVEGKKLDVLGGEGLEIEQPMTRKSFDENFDL